MIAWAVRDIAETLLIKPEKIHVSSPYIGGGFGAQAVGACRCHHGRARCAGGEASGQGRAGATADAQHDDAPPRDDPARAYSARARDGRIDAIAHESWSGDLPDGDFETAAFQTRLLYAGANRMTAHRLATLHLAEGNAMRAPGEAVGHLALEVAMDELAEKLGIDPVELRILNDIQHDPEKGPERPFSSRKLVECLKVGAERFGWAKRNPKPGQVRDGDWLIGMGVVAAFRNNPTMDSAARVGVDAQGRGHGRDRHDRHRHRQLHHHRADRRRDDGRADRTGDREARRQQIAGVVGVRRAVGREQVDLRCLCRVHEAARRAGAESRLQRRRSHLRRRADQRGRPQRSARRRPPGRDGLTVEDKIEFGDLQKKFAQAAFGAHFVEVGVDTDTGETRVRRMSGVFAAGRILNPKSARSQIIGAMTMGIGAALMEELVVDKRLGYFVNHDLAEYHVPVHADIPHQDVHFLDELDDKSSPMKAKGVGELGICGAGAAVANAIYNATACGCASIR